MLFLLILCFAAALAGTALLVRFARGHARRYSAELPQRFHFGQVPRLGGLAIWAASTVGWCWMALSQHLQLPNQIRGEAAVVASLWIGATITLLTLAALSIWFFRSVRMPAGPVPSPSLSHE